MVPNIGAEAGFNQQDGAERINVSVVEDMVEPPPDALPRDPECCADLVAIILTKN